MKEKLTDNFIVETYTWNVLARLANEGNAGAKAVVGDSGKIDIHAGIVRELQWAREQLTS